VEEVVVALVVTAVGSMVALAGVPTNIHSRELCPLQTASVHLQERGSLPSSTSLLYCLCIVLISILKLYYELQPFLNGTALVFFMYIIQFC
jgi:hypothetical protein